MKTFYYPTDPIYYPTDPLFEAVTMSKLSENIKLVIKKEMTNQNIIQADLLRLIGMNQSQFSKLINGKQSMTLTSLEKISGGLGLQVSALLRLAENFKQ